MSKDIIISFIRRTNKAYSVDFLKRIGCDTWKEHGSIVKFESEEAARLYAEKKSDTVEICYE